MILEAILKHPYNLGKYHFLPPGGGGLLEFGGEHMNFGNQKGEHKDFWYLKGGGGGGGQKKFTDPIKKS